MRRSLNVRSDSGFTLIELVVAIVVLSLGTLAVLRAADQSALAISGSTERALAQIAVQNRAEELRFVSAEAGLLPDTVRLGGQVFHFDQTQTVTVGGLIEMRLTARGPSGAGAQMVIYLPSGPV